MEFSTLITFPAPVRKTPCSATSLLSWAIVVAVALSSHWVMALQVTGLYSHKLEVANESSSERNRAFGDALAAVIVKVTGEQRWLLDPAVIQAVSNASSFVERVSYFSETQLVEAPAEDAEATIIAQESIRLDEPLAEDESAFPQSVSREIEQRFINVEFSESLIDDLLIDAKIPLWDSNRPSVLVWMALQDESGERSFLTAENHPDIVAMIQDFAELRGLPIIFPVFDFEDRRSVNEDIIWSLDDEVIRSASARYGADSIMSGRLHFTAGGELVGVWQFMFQDQLVRFDSVDLELESYINAPLDKITTQLANFFAIVPETDSMQSALLRVDGVGSLEEYSSLLSYISGLGLVEAVTTKSLAGQRIELSLSLVGEPNQLVDLIALDRDLLPIGRDNLEDEVSFHYRWTR